MAIDLSAVSGMTPSGLAVPGYIEEEIKKTRRLREEQELVAAAIRSAAAATGAGSSGFSAMGEAIGSVSKLLSSLHGQFGSTIKGATDLSFSLQAVAGSTPGDISALSASLEISSGKAKAAANDFLGLGAAFGAIKGHIAENIGDWAAQGVGKLVDVQREFDKLNTTMVAATGSSANAAREFQWLRQFAMDTPVSLAEVTQGFVKMKAAGLDPTKESLTSFSNTATAMGVDFSKTIDAVTSAADGDFGGLAQLGINAKKEGDNVALTFQGVTTTVKNNSDEIVGYIEKIGNTTFDGATAKHAQALDGALSKLGNTWDELFRSISEGDAGSLIYDSVTLANGVLRDASAILRAVGGAAGDAGKDLGALSVIQSGIATVFETVAVLGVNVKYVLVTIGNEIGGLVAQIAQGAQAAGRFLVGDFTGAKESASAFAEIRRQMVADAEAARTEVDATTARILKARDVVKGSSQTSSNAAPNPPASTTQRPRDVDAGSAGPPATPAQPVSVPAVAAAVCGNPAACSSCCKPGPTPAAQAVTMQQSQSQQQQARVATAAAAATSSQAAAKAAVVAAVSASSSSSLSGFIPPPQGLETPPKKTGEVADEYKKATDAIRQQTAELAKQRETLQDSIKTVGMSEIAIAKLNVKDTKERIDAAITPGAVDNQPDRLEALQKLLAEQQATAATKEQADYSKRGHALKEQIEQSRENNTLVHQEINLTGLSQLERSKITALRTIEVRQAKELNEIEKSGHTGDRKKELSDKVREKSRIDAETEVQKLVQADWQKTADQINASLTDAFMKSLESGKDFGKNLGNALKEQFKSLVLKPTISAMMSPISGMLSSAVSGIMGGGGPGSSGTLGNLLSLGQSAYSAYTGTGPLAAGWNALSSWAGLGGAASTGTGILVSTGGATTVGSTLATGAQGLSLQAASANFASGIGSGIPGMTTGSTFVGTGGGTGLVVNTANPALGSLGSGGAAGGAGASAAAVLGWLAVVAAIGNMMGVFASERKVGEGLRGTLTGNSDDQLRAWEETRYGGTLINGPKYKTMEPLTRLKEYKKTREQLRAEDAAEDAKDVELRKSASFNMDERDALNQSRDGEIAAFTQGIIDLQNRTEGLEEKTRMQSKAIQEGYKVARDGVVKMTANVGLSTESVKNFAFELDTQDLNFQGLNAEQIQAKIVAALDKSTNKMAEGLLGHWETYTVDLEERIWTNVGGEGQQMAMVFTDVTKTVERTRYAASEFAKDGERPIETLSRLSNSFTMVNDAMDALGFGTVQASLAVAGAASDIVDAFGGMQAFMATTSSFLNAYYTGEERRQALAGQGSRALAAKGFTISPEALASTTSGQMRDFVNSLASGNKEDYAWAMNFAVSMSGLYQSTDTAAASASDLAGSVDELTQKFISAKDALANDAKSLAVDLLRAQGNEAGAKALEKANYLSQFDGLDESRRQELATGYDANTGTRRAIDVQNERNGLQNELNGLTDTSVQALTRQRNALDESNRALFDNVQAVKLQKTIAQELPGVLDKFRTPAQRRAAQYDTVTADLNAVGLNVTADHLMGASKAQIGAAAAAIYNLGGISDEARLALVRAAGALADLKDADVDNAFAALERAVDAQRTVLNDAITELTTVFETARDAAKSLFGEVESAVHFQGDEGRAFISNALSVAQSTGYLPDSEKFSKAVSDATGALGQQMFATQAESDYQRLVLANELKGLQDISGNQLEKTKTQLQTLEDQLIVQRQQVEALGGIDTSVLSVEQAIDRLTIAINGAQPAQAASRASTTLTGSGGASYDLSTGTGTNAAGTFFRGEEIKEAAFKAIREGATPQQIYNIVRDSGFTMAQAEQIAGSATGSLQKLEAEMGWGAAYGGTGNYEKKSAYSASAMAEPTAYDPMAAGNALAVNTQVIYALQDVRAELVEMRKQNDQLQYAASRTADAVNGRPEAPMLVENV